MATSPTLAGFIAWIRGVMGVDSTILPDDAPVINVAYCVARDIVNPQLASIGGPCAPSDPCAATPSIYALAVYNLGGDNLINYAPDDPLSATPTFWLDLREKFHIGAFVAGVISSSADQGTSQTILNPDFMKGLTMANLGQLKTPYGRQYMAFAQDIGPLWGLS